MALLFLSSFVVVGVISLLVSGNIARPMVEMAAVSRKIESGDLSARQTVSSDDELGYLAQSLDGMAESIQKQMVALESIAELNKVIAGASSLDTFYDKLLQKLMDLTGSVLGVCFVTDSEEADIFELRSAVGINPERLDPFDPGGLDGELRKALMSGQICRIAQIPRDTPFTFRTFAGMAVPRDILTIPVRTDGHVAMVLSIASLHDYSDHHISIIEHTWPVMGTALSNLLGIEATRKLMKKLHAQNLELEAQSEQLQVQTEELYQQSEELQQQTEELQQQNIDLEAQSRQVEEANRLKSEFLSNMSHELRTPLNSVMALSKVLIMQARKKLSEEEISYLEIIERNGRKLLSLINDILDLSKIEAGRIELKPKKLSPRLVLGDIMERLQPMAEVKGVELLGDIPDDLPLIESDEARVDQIFQNLIGNAIKFTEKGSVRVTAFSDPDRVYVHVSDTGIGIPSEQMQKVFDEFHQVDGSSSRRYEGTGLGLAIVKKATGLLGGQVLVESTLGSGTTFRVSLPIWWQGETTREAEPASASPDRFEAVHAAAGKRSVLVVDDEPKTVALVSQYLQEEGYRALEAVSGATALNLAELYHPFAIILDILMPDMDGFEVLQALKRNPKTADIPVIVISVKGDRKTGAALGAAGFIAKPVLKESLIGELKKISKPAPRMLVVEDNDAAIIQIKSMLEREGYPVDIAQGGKQAMDYLEHSVPDGIILDLMMPEVDGFEVLERIRSRQATAATPVLVLTAKDLTMEDKNRLSLCNIQQVVHKGDVDIEELLMKVRLMIGRGSNPEAPAQTDASRSSGEAEMIPLVQPASIDTKKTREGLRTVLIIEDNPDNMITVKAVLGGSYRLLEATDGETGLNMAVEQSPDLVLLDIALPGMDGFAVARKLRECESVRCIPIIALTAKAMKGDRERILEAGCNDCVSKPLNPEVLLAKVDEWLHG
jgi:CheY-like chemotaxis protein/HAMP domain-containing protein